MKPGRFELDPHRVGARAAAVFERGGALGLEVGADYQYRHGRLTLGAALVGRRTTATLPVEEQREWSLQAALLAGARFEGDRLRWGVAAGPVLRAIGQDLTAAEAGRLHAAGLDAERTRSGLGAGLTVGLRAALRTGPVDIGPTLDATALLVREGGSPALRLDLAPGLGAGVVF